MWGNIITSNNQSTLTHSHKSIYTPELSLPRVCHRQRADPSELGVELRPLRVELLAYVQKVTGDRYRPSVNPWTLGADSDKAGMAGHSLSSPGQLAEAGRPNELLRASSGAARRHSGSGRTFVGPGST